jgi:nucleoside-diphosphate-sugar epimerase
MHLILGGSGTVGTALASFLAGRGERVRCLDRRAPRTRMAGVEHEVGDVRAHDFLAPAFAGARVVYFTLVDLRFLAREAVLRQSNVHVLERVLALAQSRSVEKVVVISSSVVYGAPDEVPVGPTSLFRPLGVYGRIRLEAESTARAALGRGLNVTVLRPHFILGPRCPGVLTPAFRRLARRRSLRLPRALGQLQQTVDLRDLVRACWLASSCPLPGFFDLGAPSRSSLAELIRQVAAEDGLRCNIHWLSEQHSFRLLQLEAASGRCLLGPSETRLFLRGFHCDCSAARETLGWEPEISEREVVESAYSWFRSHRTRGG